MLLLLVSGSVLLWRLNLLEGWPFTRKTGPPPNYTIGKVLVQNVLILVSCASVWQTEARLTILWRNCSFKLCYEMVSHLDVFGGFRIGWNRLKQYGCASAQTIVFFMEGAPSTLHTILRGRGIFWFTTKHVIGRISSNSTPIKQISFI